MKFINQYQFRAFLGGYGDPCFSKFIKNGLKLFFLSICLNRWIMGRGPMGQTFLLESRMTKYINYH